MYLANFFRFEHAHRPVVLLGICILFASSAFGQGNDPALSRHDWLGECGRLLFDPDAWYNERFGASMDSDGEWLVIGNPNDDTACPFDPICTAGSAYIFRRENGGTYILWQKIVPDDIRRLDSMGSCVAIQGSTVMAERGGEDIGGGNGAGEIMVYALHSDHWTLDHVVVSGSTLQTSGFGSIFKLHTEWLAARTTYLDVDGRPIELAIEIFRNIEGVWTYQDSVTDPLGRPRADWILDLAILPDGTLAVADHFDDTRSLNAGIVRVFEPVDGRWVLTQELLAPDGQPFYGIGLDADAGRIAVGHAAGLVDGPTGPVVGGRVDIYERGPDRWQRTHAIGLREPMNGDALGWNIELDGDRLLAIASDRPNPTASLPDGAWAIFDFDGLSWRQTLLASTPPWGLSTTSIAIELDGPTTFIGQSQWSPRIGLERVGAVAVYDIACLSCQPDLDHDGVLTIFDYLTFQTAFGTGDPLADFDGDSELTLFDFLAFQTAFGQGCP